MLNIFKKKAVVKKTKTVLCIPGNWGDRSEIVKAITKANINEFICAGRVIMNIKTNKSFEIQIEEYDNRIKESFRIAGKVNRVENSFIEEIGNHKSVVYLIGETGNFKDAKEIADAGMAVLNAGGMGIKVETSGKAFTKGQWKSFLENFEESELYQMYVLDSISDGKGTIYTCGMHNLGLKDSIIKWRKFSR